MAARQLEVPMLATLEVVTEGVSAEPVHRLRAPLAHIGHGQHTNVVAVDDSYSGSHAGTQRRESDWFVADMDSTNGTNLANEGVLGNRALNSDTAVRFRGVKVIFRSKPELVDAACATDLLVIQDC
jgi:pSer/pThr/pTyr-binding forkhead associated (FHA) protein